MPRGISHPYAERYPREKQTKNFSLKTNSPEVPVVFGNIWKALQNRESDRRDEMVRKGTIRERPPEPRDHLRSEDKSYGRPPEARKGKKLKPVANMALRWRLGLQPPKVEVIPPTHPVPKEPLIMTRCTKCGKHMELGEMEVRKWGEFCSVEHAEQSKPYVMPTPRFLMPNGVPVY